MTASRFQHRRAVADARRVQDRHCWRDFIDATQDTRGWSLMDQLIYQCDRALVILHSLHRSERPGKQYALRQNRESLRGLICAIQRLERGEPSALNGLSARIDPETIPRRLP